MQIFIKTLTGRKQAFSFEPEAQILAVKQQLQEKEGIQGPCGLLLSSFITALPARRARFTRRMFPLAARARASPRRQILLGQVVPDVVDLLG